MYSINILYEMTNGFRWNNVKTTRNSTKPNINIVVFFCSAFAMPRIYYLPTTEFALRQQNIQSIKNFVLSSIFQYEYGCSLFFLRSLILAQNSIAVLHPKFNFCRRKLKTSTPANYLLMNCVCVTARMHIIWKGYMKQSKYYVIKGSHKLGLEHSFKWSLKTIRSILQWNSQFLPFF